MESHKRKDGLHMIQGQQKGLEITCMLNYTTWGHLSVGRESEQGVKSSAVPVRLICSVDSAEPPLALSASRWPAALNPPNWLDRICLHFSLFPMVGC